MPANKDKSAEGSSMSGRSRELKPPDLWTHGRNLESKMTDRGSNGDPDELTEMMSRHASSIDEGEHSLAHDIDGDDDDDDDDGDDDDDDDDNIKLSD